MLSFFAATSPFSAAIAGFTLTVLLIRLLNGPASRLGLVDRPGGRKIHEGLIPLTGGWSIYGGFLLASLFCKDDVAPILLEGMGFVLLIGTVDDRYKLSARLRLAAEVAAALIMAVLGGKLVQDLGDMLGTGSLSLVVLAVPYTVLCTVGLINAFNMADGIDGLASGLAASALAWFIVAALLAGRPIPEQEWLLLSAILGFMTFNSRHPLNRRAKVFLGDSGSMLLGFGVAWFAIQAAEDHPSKVLSPMAVAWVLALPVIDTIRLIVQRSLAGRTPFKGDLDHLHHILLRKGLTPGQISWLLIGINVAFGAIGVLGHHFGIGDRWLTLGFIVAFAVHYKLTVGESCLAQPISDGTPLDQLIVRIGSRPPR